MVKMGTRAECWHFGFLSLVDTTSRSRPLFLLSPNAAHNPSQYSTPGCHCPLELTSKWTLFAMCETGESTWAWIPTLCCVAGTSGTINGSPLAGSGLEVPSHWPQTASLIPFPSHWPASGNGGQGGLPRCRPKGPGYMEARNAACCKEWHRRWSGQSGVQIMASLTPYVTLGNHCPILSLSFLTY